MNVVFAAFGNFTFCGLDSQDLGDRPVEGRVSFVVKKFQSEPCFKPRPDSAELKNLFPGNEPYFLASAETPICILFRKFREIHGEPSQGIQGRTQRCQPLLARKNEAER